MTAPITITLPWPPSVNHMYRRTEKGGLVITATGNKYRKAVAVQCMLLGLHRVDPIAGPVRVDIDAYLPDRRKRDIDNILKTPCDCLTKARVWEDDSQIMQLHVIKHPVGSPPGIRVRITPL